MYAVQGASSPARVRCWLLMGGTLAIRHGCTASLVLLRRGTWLGCGRAGRAVGFSGNGLCCSFECWLFENCIVDASICGQVFKGARWMPWHQEPMKDVGGRDRPRGAVNRAVIRGCPNGETRQSSWAVTYA